MFCKFVPTPPAGCHRNRTRSERFSACNITRRIANDVNLRRFKLAAVLLFSAGTREPPKLVTVPVIVGKGAKLEEVPDAIMLKLQSRAPRNVTGEKRQDNMRPRFEPFQ